MMNLPDNLIWHEIESNFISLASVLIGVLWLSVKQGWIKAAKVWYEGRIDDPKGIIAPSLAILTFPFILPNLIQLWQSIKVQEIPYIVPSIVSLSTFILGQELSRKRAKKDKALERLEEDKRKRTAESVLFLRASNELEWDSKTLQRNYSDLSDQDDPWSGISPSALPLTPYQNRYLIQLLDEQTDALLRREAFSVTNKLSELIGEINQLIQQRQAAIDQKANTSENCTVPIEDAVPILTSIGFFNKDLKSYKNKINDRHDELINLLRSCHPKLNPASHLTIELEQT